MPEPHLHNRPPPDLREQAKQLHPQHAGARDMTRENRKDRGIRTGGTTRARTLASKAKS